MLWKILLLDMSGDRNLFLRCALSYYTDRSCFTIGDDRLSHQADRFKTLRDNATAWMLGYLKYPVPSDDI